MNNMKDHPRWKELNAGVRRDGTIKNTAIETYVAFPMAVKAPQQFGYEVDLKNRFVGFAVDNGVTDIEVRLPFETIEQMAEWIKKPPTP